MNYWPSMLLTLGLALGPIFAEERPQESSKSEHTAGGKSGWLAGKSWQVGAKATIPQASQLSGCAWHRDRNTVLIINESNAIYEVNESGKVLRLINLVNPPTKADFESITIISRNAHSDTVGIGHEGIGTEVVPHVLVLDLPHGATNQTLDLSTAKKLDLAGFGADTEAIAWNDGRSLFHVVRVDEAYGTMTREGKVTVAPRQSAPRFNTNDAAFNSKISPNPIWFGGYRYIEERDPANGKRVALADIGDLLGHFKWEGLAVSDNGSLFIVGEKATENFIRLDLKIADQGAGK